LNRKWRIILKITIGSELAFQSQSIKSRKGNKNEKEKENEIKRSDGKFNKRINCFKYKDVFLYAQQI
jgi:hypothetical protein